MSGTDRLRHRHPISPRHSNRPTFTMDNTKKSSRRSTTTDHTNDDDTTSSYISNSSNGSKNSRSRSNNNPPRQQPNNNEFDHIDEEHGVASYDLTSKLLLPKHLQNKKHKLYSISSDVDNNVNNNNNNNGGDNGVVDADDTKNNSESDMRSRTLQMKTAFWITVSSTLVSALSNLFIIFIVDQCTSLFICITTK